MQKLEQRDLLLLRQTLAGRGTDIKLGGNPEFRARKAAGTEAGEEEYRKAYIREYEKWKKDYEEVKNCGGLFVLGTERHESRRIDNQLRGRSGRQGDPGRSKFYISLDDTLMRLFGGENMKNLMSKAGMKDDEPIHHPWISKSIEKAQKRVEERNYEIRKHLLEYDDVLNEHRKYIYTQRDSILSDENQKDRIISIVDEYLNEIFPDVKNPAENSQAAEMLAETLMYKPEIDQEKLDEMSPDEFRDEVYKTIKADMDDKEDQLGKENFNMFAKIEYMRSIDAKWQDHLENLEALREAVYLRTYGQKNPLLEYKLEGFEIFDNLIEDIRKAVVRKLINVRIRNFDSDRKSTADTAAQATHQAMNQLSSGSANSKPTGVQVKRSVPKVGRNDMCPCGSGKKYKHCHGR